MTDSDSEIEKLVADDGHDIHVHLWNPSGRPQGLIQIFHGLGEYGRRYERFAQAATAQGFAIGVHDHRGHGKYSESRGYFAPRNGWALLLTDSLLVHEHLAARYPEVPITLLGHSMGSYVAQNFAMHYGDRLAALMLSASTLGSRIETGAGNMFARFECWRLGDSRNSALLDKLGFGDFNKPFLPARTEFDWLSRDTEEVDTYASDPLCGGPYTAGLWRDLTGGLFSIASSDMIARVPTDLPILITGGEKDPVGGEHGMGKLAMRYATTGHGRLTVKIYPDGRHEMLNEINRDDVTADWLDWISQNAKKSPAQ